MFRKSRNGWIVAAVTVALLALPLAPVEADGGQAPAAPATLWSQLLGWLEAVWMEAGSDIDPDGRPHATTHGDEGSGIDPFG